MRNPHKYVAIQTARYTRSEIVPSGLRERFAQRSLRSEIAPAELRDRPFGTQRALLSASETSGL